MTRRGEEQRTKVYTRCEVCGKIVRPDGNSDVPEGWVVLGKTPGFNATRVACSAACAAKANHPG